MIFQNEYLHHISYYLFLMKFKHQMILIKLKQKIKSNFNLFL